MDFFCVFEAKRRWDRKKPMEQRVGRGTFTPSHPDRKSVCGDCQAAQMYRNVTMGSLMRAF